MSYVCSRCQAKVAGDGPYREGNLPEEPPPPPTPWLTAKRKAWLKRWAFLLGVSVVGASAITGGVFFIPKAMLTLGAGLLVVLAGVAASYIVFVVPHKTGLFIARKCKWDWFDSNPGEALTYCDYKWGDCGPGAWFVGIGAIGAIPTLYGLGCLGIYLVR